MSSAADSLRYIESLEVLPRLAAMVQAAMCADVSRTTHDGGDWSWCLHKNALPCPLCAVTPAYGSEEPAASAWAVEELRYWAPAAVIYSLSSKVAVAKAKVGVLFGCSAAFPGPQSPAPLNLGMSLNQRTTEGSVDDPCCRRRMVPVQH